jgi:hypothetical protein
VPPQAPRNNLPPDVVRVLSFHGLVEVVVGEDDAMVSGRASVAPFEDVLQLLVPTDSPVERALLRTPVTAVQARAKDGEYSLRLTGHACAGRPLTSHPERGSLEPWVADGVRLASLSVVTFAAHTCELTRNEAGGQAVRYHGPTPLGKTAQKPHQTWLLACLGGVALPFFVMALVLSFGWLVYQGEGYRFRPLAWVLSAGAAFGAVGGVRLMTLSLAFHRWRAGRAREADAPLLTEGLIAPGQARTAGIALLGLWAACVGAIAAIWGDDLMWWAALSHGAWLWGPAVVAHLMAGQPE